MSTAAGGKGKKATRIIFFVITLIFFLIYMFPFILLILNAFKNKRDIITAPFSFAPSKGFTFDNFTQAFKQMNFMSAFGNSVLITLCSTFFVIVLSSMLAFYFVRAKNKFSKIGFGIMTASMIIPFQAIMIPLVSIYGAQLGMLNHRASLIFFHVGFGISMSVFMYQGFIKSSVPVALEEAALLDGCNKLQTFIHIVFPLLKPTTATLVILNVLAFWNDYLLPSLVLKDKNMLTLPLSTYTFYGTYSADYGLIMAALVLTILPILVLFLFLQKSIISGVISGAVK